MSNFPTSVEIEYAANHSASWNIDRNYHLFDSTSKHNKLMHAKHSKYSDVFWIENLEWQLCLCKNDSKSPLLIGINPILDDTNKEVHHLPLTTKFTINVITPKKIFKTTRREGGNTVTDKMFFKDNVMWCMHNSFTGPFIVLVTFEPTPIIRKTDGSLQQECLNTQRCLTSLGRMLSENIYTDITINTLDGVKIGSHRAVLASTSPVFHKMFSHDLQEKEHSTINIIDMSTKSCQVFFKYIYGNMKNEELVEHREDLLNAANKYDIPELKETCVESFIHDIDRKNVVEMIRIANLYGLTKLKNRCMRFLAKSGNVFEIEEDLKELRKSEDTGLVDEIFLEILKNSQGMEIRHI